MRRTAYGRGGYLSSRRSYSTCSSSSICNHPTGIPVGHVPAASSPLARPFNSARKYRLKQGHGSHRKTPPQKLRSSGGEFWGEFSSYKDSEVVQISTCISISSCSTEHTNTNLPVVQNSTPQRRQPKKPQKHLQTTSLSTSTIISLKRAILRNKKT